MEKAKQKYIERQDVINCKEEDEDADDDDKITCDKCNAILKRIKENFNMTFTGNSVAYERDQKAREAKLAKKREEKLRQ